MSGRSFTLTLRSPKGVYYEGECESLKVTAQDGLMGFLAGHSPMTVALTEGKTCYTVRQDGVVLHTGPGILQFARNRALVLTDWIQEGKA